MKKRILLSLAAVVAISLGIVGMSAYEAHIINVTAHIENALNVPIEEIRFGTVFPQEYLESSFDIALSSSFLGENRVDDVEYVIKQKSKCECDEWVDESTPIEICPEGQYAPLGYATHVCPAGYTAMLSLCPFLSKTSTDANDTSHPSYFIDPTPAAPNSGDEHCLEPVRYTSSDLNYSSTGWGGWSCPPGTVAVGGGVIENAYPMGAEGIAEPGATIGGETYPVFPHYTFGTWYDGETGYVAQNGGTPQTCKIYVDCLAIVPDASGKLIKSGDPADISDTWIVDLKVPPFKGYVAQDWPAGCPVLQGNPEGIDLGCDLWVEVTGISPMCGNGSVDPGEQCETPADCPTGATYNCIECQCVVIEA